MSNPFNLFSYVKETDSSNDQEILQKLIVRKRLISIN